MRGIHGQPVSLASAARDVADLRGRCAASLVHPGGRRTRADPKRGLEEHLGARVFQRRHRGIELTPDGRTLLEGVRAGLDSVLLASERVRKQRRVGVLTVAAPAAFAIWWLVPRLGRFAALHPEIEVRIAAIDGREPDLWRDGIDVAVVKRPAKLVNGNGAGSRAEMPLLREIVFPVCAPSLNAGLQPLQRPRDLLQQTLI